MALRLVWSMAEGHFSCSRQAHLGRPGTEGIRGPGSHQWDACSHTHSPRLLARSLGQQYRSLTHGALHTLPRTARETGLHDLSSPGTSCFSNVGGSQGCGKRGHSLLPNQTIEIVPGETDHTGRLISFSHRPLPLGLPDSLSRSSICGPPLGHSHLEFLLETGRLFPYNTDYHPLWIAGRYGL